MSGHSPELEAAARRILARLDKPRGGTDCGRMAWLYRELRKIVREALERGK